MLERKFQIALKFDAETAGALVSCLEAEELLRSELLSGLIPGHEINHESVQLLIMTGSPKHCLEEIMRRLSWIPILPKVATIQALQPNPRNEIIPIGEKTRLEVGLPADPSRRPNGK